LAEVKQGAVVLALEEINRSLDWILKIVEVIKILIWNNRSLSINWLYIYGVWNGFSTNKPVFFQDINGFQMCLHLFREGINRNHVLNGQRKMH
jgi:hypothetical protein